MSLGDYLDLQASETILSLPHYFIGGMMPKPSNPLQQSTRVIEIRPYRDGEDAIPSTPDACATAVRLETRRAPFGCAKSRRAQIDRAPVFRARRNRFLAAPQD